MKLSDEKLYAVWLSKAGYSTLEKIRAVAEAAVQSYIDERMWPSDDEGNRCNVCGEPVRYGERHATCGKAIRAAEKAAVQAERDGAAPELFDVRCEKCEGTGSMGHPMDNYPDCDVCKADGFIPTPLFRHPPQASAKEPVAVHQFRKAFCADWYDGFPDKEDHGGPYEERTLYTRPPQASATLPEGLWERFAGYLIDNCEGLIVSEENIQMWMSEMLAASQKGN